MTLKAPCGILGSYISNNNKTLELQHDELVKVPVIDRHPYQGVYLPLYIYIRWGRVNEGNKITRSHFGHATSRRLLLKKNCKYQETSGNDIKMTKG